MRTWFPRKDICKGTWRIPGTNDTNQIDHVLVSKRWASDIENVRTYRGANSESDNFLVGARLKQKIALMTRNGIENRKRWNVDKFYETDVECHYQQYYKSCKENYHLMIQRKNGCVKKTLITSAQDIIGEKQHERNVEWYDQEC